MLDHCSTLCYSDSWYHWCVGFAKKRGFKNHRRAGATAPFYRQMSVAHCAVNGNKMSLYVLAEKRGTRIDAQSGASQALVELLTIQHPSIGECFALFLSPVDAAICKQYLNRQRHDGQKNHYEMRVHTDPAVANNIKTVGRATQMRASLVSGFATDASGKLVVQAGLYSLVHMPLLPGDMNWIFAAAPKPKPDVLTSVYAGIAQYGAPDHQDDINRLDMMEPEAINKIAEIALAQIGAKTAGTGNGFSLYSPSRQAWRRLA